MKVLALVAVLLAGCHAFDCPGDGLFRDPKSCEKYYHCAGGRSWHKSCPPGLHFSVKAANCDWPANADCKVGPTDPPPPTTTPPPTEKPSTTTPTGPTETPGPDSDKDVVCYFINWAWYRPGAGKYKPEDIDPKLCTVVNYAFSVLGSNGKLRMHDSWADKDNKFYEKTVALKKAPGSRVRKVFLAIGGWNDSLGPKYSNMVMNRSSRKAFIDHVVPFLLKYGFDGLDLDWEYPQCWQGDCKKGKQGEKKAFADWCAELKAAFKPHGLQLSAAVSASKTIIDAGYDVPRIAKSLDILNLMTYDFHGSWEKQTGHNAPMYECEGDAIPFFNVDSAVNHWIKSGFPARKIVLGLPIYGRSFTLKDPKQNGIGAPTRDGGIAGKWTRAKGFLGYYEICLNLKNGWTEVKGSSCTVGPYAYKGNQWVGYDSLESVKYKMEYIKKKGLGGGMVWDVTMDDFHGACGQGKNPFLTAMRRYLA